MKKAAERLAEKEQAPKGQKQHAAMDVPTLPASAAASLQRWHDARAAQAIRDLAWYDCHSLWEAAMIVVMIADLKRLWVALLTVAGGCSLMEEPLSRRLKHEWRWRPLDPWRERS
jgi:hypothetical protein